MKTYYYKASDPARNKRTGTIEAANARAADAALRRDGLQPYFIKDYRLLKKSLRRRKKRQRMIVVVGAVAVAASVVLSGVMVRYAGRERALDARAFKDTDFAEDHPGEPGEKTDKRHEFALEIQEVWDSLYPGVVTEIEVRRTLMTIYGTRQIAKLSDDELEFLGTNCVRALQRRFGSTSCTLLVAEEDVTILEITYVGLSRSVRVRFYR